MSILYPLFNGHSKDVLYVFWGPDGSRFFCLSYITLSKIWYMLQKHQEWRLFSLENVAYTAQGLKTSSKPTSEPDTKCTVPDVHCLAVFAKDHIRSAIRSNQASYP